MNKNKSYGNIISTQELKAHLQDNNKARMYEKKKENEHKKKEDEMIKTWKDEIAMNKGGQ